MEFVELTSRQRGPVRSGPLAGLLPLVLIIWGFVGVYLIQLALDAPGQEHQRERAVEEMMYFPSGRFMRPASIEYQVLAADLVWLRAVQYYGHHLMTDQKYEWLGHIFEILTELDPRFIGAYHFGAYTLAWDARNPEEALALLRKGMKRNPLEWRLPFDAGFINYMLTRDYDAAARYFRIAAELPGGWHVTRRWAPFAAARAGRIEEAWEEWLEVYRGTENIRLRELALRHLRALRIEQDVARLQEAASRFQEDRGYVPERLGELVRAGYIDALPSEPDGIGYYLDRGQVRVRRFRALKLDQDIAFLQAAADRFREDRGHPPATLDDLVRAGYVLAIPEEPYGGRYSIDRGRVRSSTPVHLRE